MVKSINFINEFLAYYHLQSLFIVLIYNKSVAKTTKKGEL